MPRYLLLRLEAPLMSFGREAIDANGPTRDFPDASMLTGLIANALGWTRCEAAAHQRLQDRLSFGVLIERLGHDLRDFQTAKLRKNDQGWTTRGVPEGRDGGASTYDSPHIRFRHYRADAAILVAINLAEADEPPTLDVVAAAFAEPARPLFIGRKPCLPSAPLFAGIVEAPDVVAALRLARSAPPSPLERYVLAPLDASRLDDAAVASRETLRLTGQRDWIAGVHAGQETRIAVTLRAGTP